MTRAQTVVLGAVLAAGLVTAVWVLARRVDAERANRTVSVVVDYNRVQELAGMTGVGTQPMLRRLRAAGATHTAIREESLGELILAEKVDVVPRDGGVALVPAPDCRDRVFTQLEARLPGSTREPDGSVFYPRVRELELVRGMGMGYPEDAVADARASGLRVVARPIGEMTITEASIRAAVQALRDVHADAVVFAGIQVFGLPGLVDVAAEELQRAGIIFASLEMARQYGEDRMASHLGGNVIRCHAIAAEEMIRLPVQRAVDRYALAVRERNVRMVYVRPYSQAAQDPVHEAERYVAAITQSIREAGFETGMAQFHRRLQLERGALALLLAGVAAAALWLVQLIWGLRAPVFWGLVVAAVGLSFLAAFAAGGMAQSLGALGAAVVFPTLALLAVRPPEGDRRVSLGRGVTAFVAVSLVSLLGGLLVAAFLSDRAHMLQLSMFRGVKLAQVVPLLAVAAFFVARSTDRYREIRTELGSRLPEWPALREGAVEAASVAVRYWHVGLVVLGMALAALMLMRSGNISPVPPSQAEMRVRTFLESTLVARPRTKEILVGHPALIISLAFLLAGRRRGWWAGMALGAVGQVSLVNTFAHTHTPLLISLLRVFNGLWLGVVGAVVLWAVGLVVWGVGKRRGWW